MAKRPSSITQLPPEMQELIGKLRGLGWTIDQIRAHLEGLLDRAPSRSALGRHIHGLEPILERARRSRAIAEVMVDKLGEAPEGRAARMNIELLHSALMDLFMRDADGETVDGEGAQALRGNPEGIQLLAKAVDHLARASKSNAEFEALVLKRIKAAVEEAKKEAVATVETIAKKGGITADTLAEIKRGIFGVGA